MSGRAARMEPTLGSETLRDRNGEDDRPGGASLPVASAESTFKEGNRK
jgi:hypothetical protein